MENHFTRQTAGGVIFLFFRAYIFLTEYARSHRKFGFRALLKKQSSKVQVVVTFLAILQLMKEGVIFIEQNQPFDEIMITSKVEEV